MEKRKDGFLIDKGAFDKDFIFGTRAVMESIHAGKEIDKVLVQKNSTTTSSRNYFSFARQNISQ
jgi:23S rRNA (guanosine2251-2'-O)-methyltransferase